MNSEKFSKSFFIAWIVFLTLFVVIILVFGISRLYQIQYRQSIVNTTPVTIATSEVTNIIEQETIEVNATFTPIPTIVPTSSNINETHKLIAYYPLDGTAVDESGNEHHGLILGNPKIIEGVRGTALQFDGNDSIQIPNSSDFEPGREDYSVTVWVRYQPEAIGQRVLIIDYSPESFKWLQISGDSTKEDIRFGLKSGTDNAQTMALYSPIKDGKWHFIVGVRKDIHQVSLYIDGKLVDRNFNTNLDFVATFSNDPIYIGYDPSYGEHYNDGDIDELKIFKRALPEDEILTMYAEYKP